MAKSKNDIDKAIKTLYDSATEFNDKLAVLKEWNKLEMARLRQEPEGENDIPSGLKD
jgi:hypothetical protein